MSQEEIAMKPCPFCGAPARTDLLPHSGDCPGWVQCSSCEIHQRMGYTIEEVASRWNTRALPAQGEPAAIFDECAEIALEHLGQCGPGKRGQLHLSYDEACCDIAEAIKLRASNRKTMDAVADATLLKP